MRLTKVRVLTAEQIRGFLERGYVVVKNCIPEATAREWVAAGWRRSGAQPGDPKTWKDGIVHLPFTRGVVIRDFAPKAWGAMCDILGGEERILEPGKNSWADTFIINFPDRSGGDWIPRSGYTGQWHIDGTDPEKRPIFLDSSDLALISMVAWTSMGPGYGGTEVACDSVAPVVAYLKEKPAGTTTSAAAKHVKKKEFLDREILRVDAGDVVLMSPYLVHRSVPNASADHVRFLTTQMHALREPLRFDRGESSAYSPLEVSILRALGEPRLEFRRGAR